MWIYQNTANSPPPQQAASWRLDTSAPRPAPYNPPSPSRQTDRRWLLLFGFTYLGGELWGSILYPKLSSGPLIYAQYYYETILSLCRNEQFSLLFGTRFLAGVVLFTCILLMGFCTFGLPVLFFLAFLKGAAAGTFFVQLLLDNSQKGLLSAVLLFWPAEMLMAVLSVFLLRAAGRVTLSLWRTSRGARLPALQAAQGRLLRLYLSYSILSVLPCGLMVFSCKIFGFLLGG